MGELFKGWRRKAGLVTLGLAMLLMAGWLRSAVIDDEVFMLRGRNSISVSSAGGSLSLNLSIATKPHTSTVEWRVRKVSYISDELPDDLRNLLEEKWRLKCCGFDFGELAHIDLKWGVIPYWSVVLPLTLLSAWLILGKPRKAKGGAT